MTPARVRVGVSLFSFAAEFVRRRCTLEELLERVAELELGPGVELVGFQSLRGFPLVPAAAARRLREALETHGLEPSCVGGSADVGRRGDRALTEDELVEFVAAQLSAASELGFPALTIQATTPLAAVRRLVREAERAQVVLALEIGPQLSLSGSTVTAAWELMEEVDSDVVGFAMDFGSSTRALSRQAVEAQRERGMAEEALALVVDAYARVHAGDAHPDDERRRLLGELAAFDDPEAVTFGWRTTMLFGHEPVDAWEPLLPRVVHVHAKAFEIDEHGEDATIDAPALLRLLVDGGYRGRVSSEWEGHLWVDHDDNFGPVVRQQRLLRALTGTAPTTESRR